MRGRDPADTRPNARSSGAFRKWSCSGSCSCRRSAHNHRANDERTDHYDHNDNIDNDEHGSDDYDEHGDDDYACGDRDDDDANLDNSRLITASEGGSYSRSSTWGELARGAVRERATDASVPQKTSAPNLEAARGHAAARSGQVRLSRRRLLRLRRYLRRVPRRRSREMAPRRRHLRPPRRPGRGGREWNDQPRRLAQGRRLAALGAGRGGRRVLLRASLRLCPAGVSLKAREGRRRTRLRWQHR
jgi:hypothetical protein